ncbi:MAG: phosphatidylserine/phosphatidylglycerophosphate/cardiolipin synthase family protein [Lentimicrobiaceae bacterium]|nr:phosphatidylserine/phosphatidylglycerophosphate/cardiolipin synthase family protein [Lentimicrobiaceae bacterium]
MEAVQDSYQLYDDPFRFYTVMLQDIAAAKQQILLETYRFGYDAIGQRFRDALLRKAEQGIRIRILVDSWGTGALDQFFAPLREAGAEIRHFKKLKFYFDFFTKNHRRNHRKLLVIDNHIAWTGSANYTAYSLNWREMMLRSEGRLAPYLARTFHESYDIYKKYIFKKYSFKKTLRFQDFEIVRDIPSIYRQQIKKRFEVLIRQAQQQVVIETPYFLPGFKLRKEMMEAAQRGVDVKVIIPQHSDVRLVDILRSRYLGILHKAGVKILMYQGTNLHAKAMMVDENTFAIGSANFDYRSFRYMYEMVLVGSHPEIIRQLKEHILFTLKECTPFSIEKWLRRPRIERFFEWILIPMRHLL